MEAFGDKDASPTTFVHSKSTQWLKRSFHLKKNQCTRTKSRISLILSNRSSLLIIILNYLPGCAICASHRSPVYPGAQIQLTAAGPICLPVRYNNIFTAKNSFEYLTENIKLQWNIGIEIKLIYSYKYNRAQLQVNYKLINFTNA